MTFSDDLKRFQAKVEARHQDVFANFVSAVKFSITDGSPITGSPGQPVDTGYLKDSWQPDFLSPSRATITTNVSYAPVIEDGVQAEYDPAGVDRPKGLPPAGGGSRHIKSTVGGNHSVKLTIAGASRLLDAVAQELAE